MVSVLQANLIGCRVGFVLSCFFKSKFSCSLLWRERYSRPFHWAWTLGINTRVVDRAAIVSLKSEVWSLKPEAGSRNSEVWSWKSEVRSRKTLFGFRSNQNFPKLNQLTWLSALSQGSRRRKNISCKSNSILRLSWYQNRKKILFGTKRNVFGFTELSITLKWHDMINWKNGILLWAMEVAFQLAFFVASCCTCLLLHK